MRSETRQPNFDPEIEIHDASLAAAVDAETAMRHRLVIFAAVAAVFGDAQVSDIKPVVRRRQGRGGIRHSPDFRRRVMPRVPEEAESL